MSEKPYVALPEVQGLESVWEPYRIFETPFPDESCPLGCEPGTCPVALGPFPPFDTNRQNPVLPNSPDQTCPQTDATHRTQSLTSPQESSPEVPRHESTSTDNDLTQLNDAADELDPMSPDAEPPIFSDQCPTAIVEGGIPCPECPSLVFKRPCDLSKHNLNHTRPHKCLVAGCTSTTGFATRGILHRHASSVHGIFVSPRLYCSIADCPYAVDGEKGGFAARPDNARRHVTAVHGGLATVVKVVVKSPDGGQPEQE